MAGLATLEVLKRPGTYDRVFATGRELMGTLSELLASAGLPAQVIGEPVLFDVVFTRDQVRDYRGTLKGDTDMLKRFNAALRQRGIMKGESKYYVSTAHTEADVKLTIEAWKGAIEEITKG